MNLLNDDKGKTSFGRFSSFWCLTIATILSFQLMKKPEVTYNDLWLVCAWILAGVASKQVGKFIEKMEPPKQ